MRRVIADHPTGRRPQRTGSTYESLRIAAFRRLFVVGSFAGLATQAQVIARGWLANDISDSNAGLGGVFMAFGIPMLLATPLGGVAADRYSKRLILMCTFILLLTSSAWIALAVSFDFIEYWMLLVTSAMQAVAFSFLVPARMALIGEAVGRDLLTNGIILTQISFNLARVVGPALAGTFIAIEGLGVAAVYYIGAALCLVSFLGSFGLPVGRTTDRADRRSVAAEFVDSLNYVAQRREIGRLLGAAVVVVMVGFPFIAFLPRLATEVLSVGSVGYGLLAAASAVGAVALATAIAGRAKGGVAWRIQSVAGMTFGAALIMLGIAPNYAVAVAVVFVVGATSAAFQAMNNSIALSLADLEYHGRVQSLMMLSFSGFGMAALPLGVLADGIGLRTTLVFMGAAVMVTMAGYVALSRRARRRSTVADLF
jgi:MFS family permease